MENKDYQMAYSDWMALFDLFTTKTLLAPKWNNDKPEWMKEPYMVKRGNQMTVCATNGAVIIFVDYSMLQHGIYKFPIIDKFPQMPKLLPKNKRQSIPADVIAKNVYDVNDDKTLCITVGEGCYLANFWLPIKAAIFNLGAEKITVLSKPSKTDMLVLEIVEGVRCAIMPFNPNGDEEKR